MFFVCVKGQDGLHGGDDLMEVNTISSGISMIKQWEKNDKADGMYVPNYYCVTDEYGNIVWG